MADLVDIRISFSFKNLTGEEMRQLGKLLRPIVDFQKARDDEEAAY